MRIYGWKFLAVCHCPDKSCDHKHIYSGDIFLICQVTSREHVFKGLSEFMGGSPSWRLTTLSSMVVIVIVVIEI